MKRLLAQCRRDARLVYVVASSCIDFPEPATASIAVTKRSVAISKGAVWRGQHP
jgi:hypothetical protein